MQNFLLKFLGVVVRAPCIWHDFYNDHIPTCMLLPFSEHSLIKNTLNISVLSKYANISWYQTANLSIRLTC